MPAALTILAGWYGHEAGAVLTDVGATGYVIGVAVLAGAARSARWPSIPAFIVIVLAELFGWRSVFFYLAVGGALGLLASAAHGVVWDTPDDRLLLLAAGFVGGFVYWLIAGRLPASAGRASRRRRRRSRLRRRRLLRLSEDQPRGEGAEHAGKQPVDDARRRAASA